MFQDDWDLPAFMRLLMPPLPAHWMVKLRSYIFLDSLQPRLAPFLCERCEALLHPTTKGRVWTIRSWLTRLGTLIHPGRVPAQARK